MSRTAQGFLYLTMAMVLLGSSFVAGKNLAEKLPVSVALGIRLALASAILMPLWLRSIGGRPRLTADCCGLIAIQALVGVIAFNLLLFEAYRYAGAGSVSVVFGLLPVVVVVMSILFLGERPRRSVVIACALAAAGTIQGSFAGGGEILP